MRIRKLGILALLVALYGCTPSAPMISEEDRCTRYGGIWRPEGCRTPGSGGGAM